MKFENSKENGPKRLLFQIKNRQIDYAEGFKLLCDEMGIECCIIEGVAKGIGYEPGMRIDEGFKHRWNAVRVDQHWRLVECHWGSRFALLNCVKQITMSEEEERIYFSFCNFFSVNFSLAQTIHPENL